MRIHVLTHVPFEGPAALADWAADRGHGMAQTAVFTGAPLPAPGDFDWLVIMGGPMGVGDEDRFPWLLQEKRLLERTLREGKTVLGICLGAQLLADCLGAPVFRNPSREIGWFPVSLTPKGARHPLFNGLDAAFDAFHWHGDTFGIPAGALHVARSEACMNQAFVWEERAVALQFHLESTPQSVEDLAVNSADDLVEAGPSVQGLEQILDPQGRFPALRKTLYTLLDAMCCNSPLP